MWNKKIYILAFAAFLFFLARPNPLRANTSVGCDPNPATRTNDLVSAIQVAVNTGGNQDVDLAAGCAYTLTQVNSGSGVDLNGLPIITNSVALTITGNGASITRDPPAPQFRFLSVMTNSQLTLVKVTLAGGHAVDGPPITSTQSFAASGGAILNQGYLRLLNVNMLSNQAGDAGCVLVGSPNCIESIGDTPIFFAGSGGAINNQGVLYISLSNISQNKAGYIALTPSFGSISVGGGLANSGIAQIDNSLFSYNVAGTTGSAMGDTGGGEGGAIFSSGSLMIKATSIISNNAPYPSVSMQGGGGGVASVNANLDISESYFGFNTSARGSAIIQHGGVGIISNSTFFANLSDTSYASPNNYGAIFVPNGAITLTFITLTPNQADIYGVLGPTTGNAYINNSLVAGNCDAPLNSGSLLGWAGSYNVLHPSCAFSPTIAGSNLYTSIFGLDPAGPKNNGGETPTIALLPASPAINFVPLAACSLPADQRGVARPQGGACDAGAYESKTYPRAYFPNALRGWAASW